jgi:glutathione synthase/RimK-type ligase-like ATP-grasp enzyme
VTVAIATCAALPGLHHDDEPLLDALAERGVPTRILAWDDPSVDWSTAELVVIRSTWDYMERRDEFVAWAERVDRSTALFTPAEVVRWNTEKSYLRRWAESGIATVPTRWLDRGTAAVLADLLDEEGWDRAVVKPVVSAGALGTIRLGRTEAADAQAHLDALLATGDVMVQPYLQSIEVAGETSVLWIDGVLTHAVRKRPASGDFRVQEEFGGTDVLVDVDEGSRRLVDAVLTRLDRRCRYARVDVVEGPEGERWLIEVELVEPQLFLRHSPEATARLADAITDAWASARQELAG